MKTALIILSAFIILNACKKDAEQIIPQPDPVGPSYTVPAAYNFQNVNYAGQTTRLDMMAEMKALMNTGNTVSTAVSAQKLKDMYANSNAAFTNTLLNTSGKSIKSKVFSLDQSIFESYMDSLAKAALSNANGSNGVAGVVVSSSDPNKKYLCDANGIEWTQVIEKGLMGALIYYQATAVYLDDSKIGNAIDNTTVIPNEGTAMEHGWDESFGYLAVTNEAPQSIAGIRFWGKYTNDRNLTLNTYTNLCNAYIKGRAAISAKDYATRDAQVVIIRETWEKVIAATIISYVNSTKTNFANDAIRNHNCSEIKGFIMNFKYNPTKKITNAQIAELETYLGNNFYNISANSLDQIKNSLSTIYGLDAIKNNL
jgi:Domain of unknown function (DUF4856)